MAKIRVRARTVDMLGRQQIAGLPTAISELFKNAHDAYARQVVVDFYRHDRLFVLRDDGLGMTPDEFTDRWLTLGTDSKLVESAAIVPPPVDPDQKVRPVLGEKGIGRLAIAMLGSHLLVLTRAKSIPGRTRSRKLSAAFVNWAVFELPTLDLDQIEIPMLETDRGRLPSRNEVGDLVQKSRANLRQIAKELPRLDVQRILESLDQFDLDPQEIAGFLPEGPRLDGPDGHGTHFLILPADEILEADLRPEDDDSASPLQKMLIGFSDSMIADRKDRKAPIEAEFRDHSSEGVVTEWIGPSEFFTPADFERADHRFQGRFDERGQFDGTVRIYDAQPEPYVVSWPQGAGRETKCGPFSIDFAYVQGTPSESRLDPLQFAEFSGKLRRAGGLYIYRDGIRVLPYGTTDSDFLDIEYRRSKGAGFYFFSYRRMFGAIRVTRSKNAALQEKAGREGFRQNAAYRDFKAVLENFLVQLAADFFRKGDSSDQFRKKKAELSRNEKLRQQRDKECKAVRAKLATEISEFLKDVEAGQPVEDAERIRTDFRRTLDAAKRGRRLSREDAGKLVASAARQVNDLRSMYRILRPHGVGLPRDLETGLATCMNEYENLDESVFTPLQRELETAITENLTLLPEEDAAWEVLRLTYEAESSLSKEKVKDAAIEVRKEAASLAQRVDTQVASMLADLERVFANFVTRLNDTGDDTDIDGLRHMWESLSLAEIRPRIAQLEALGDEIRSTALVGVPSAADIREAVDEELIELREAQVAQFELLQLGLAIGIIQHEFRSCVKGLRISLSKLKRWANTNAQLRTLYAEIRTNFDHLDGYLSLFTPLTRRLYRSKVDISGSEIANFITELFAERLKRHDVSLVVSEEFKASRMREFPSSVYPCFVNLVDNSLYWLASRSAKREIRFDVLDGDLVVSDSGPGVKSSDRARIFELGFTRKPGGRGMGLHISREILKKIGYELSLDPPVRGEGATFRIRKRPETELSERRDSQ